MSDWQSGGALVDDLAQIALPNVFNPYSDHCTTHDLLNGSDIRRANLAAVLDAALAQGASDLWVGLELGARGGRRTGLPLTDEIQLAACGDYWGVSTLARATSGAPVKEQTARYIWQAMATAPRRTFFWNAFPFHCHEAGCLTNRGHSRAEVALIPPVLPWLIKRLGVTRVVALGNDAQAALGRAGIASHYVRHPGRGGGKLFLQTIHTV
jgi:hypothetical protein